MADLLTVVKGFIWSETFWLPGNHSWQELENTKEGIYYPELSDILVPFYLSFFVSIVKIIFERYIAASIGRLLGLKAVVKKAPVNPILENAFQQKRAPSTETIQGLAKQTDLTTRQIERWFRVRRNQERTPVLKKFCESAWRGTFYFFIFWYGVYLHLDKPWFYDTAEAWKGWPQHNVTPDIYWYYMIEGGFYVSLLFSLFTDHKRKDFTEMIVHHFATILLMGLSWINNFTRIGTLVLLVHDAVDSWMEAAKMAKYLNFERACEVLFFTFMVIWVITRMILFPFRVIRSTMFEALPIVTPPGMPLRYDNIYLVYNILLCTLQVLHVIWFYYICLIAKDAFTGQIQSDSRSSMESASDSGNEQDNAVAKSRNRSHEANGPKDISQRNGVTKGTTTKRN